MYFIGDIPNPKCKVSLYKWNGKFFVKFETPDLEQTFKIAETEVGGEDEVRSLITDEFVEHVIARFHAMYDDLNEALNPF